MADKTIFRDSLWAISIHRSHYYSFTTNGLITSITIRSDGFLFNGSIALAAGKQLGRWGKGDVNFVLALFDGRYLDKIVNVKVLF